MQAVALPSGERVPALGQGAWQLAEGERPRDEELAALRLGLDLGLTLIDTAEVYGGGASEELVADAIAGRRDGVFVVTKVSPRNATRRGTTAACDRSLQRLRTDRIDLYLLHWPAPVPLEETLEAFQELVGAGKIRHWGVSNFEVALLEELVAVPAGSALATDQMHYSLTRRGIEADVLPWCRERGVPVMAYSPIDRGRLAEDSRLREVASRHGVTAAQVALQWLLRQGDLVVIPKAGSAEHVRENRAALDLRLTEQDLDDLERAFPG